MKILGLVLAVALGGAACGSGGEEKTTATRTPAAAALDPAATLRVALDSLLREHVSLAALATGEALGGRTKAFEAAAGALDANSVDLSKAVGSVFGADAEAAFLPLWRSHIGFVVDYTSNFGAKAKQDRAVSDLLAYTQDFGAFIAGAVPALPKDAVAELVKGHILGLKDVIDAQQKRNYAAADRALRRPPSTWG
jgi:hypothetical protein